MAQFEKGTSGNPEGRPAGSRNKSSEEIRVFLLTFLETNLEGLQSMFDDLEAKDKVRLISVILRYTISLPYNPESLTVEQLEQIINYLKNGQQKENFVSRN